VVNTRTQVDEIKRAKT